MQTDEITIDTAPDLTAAQTNKLIAEQNDRFRKAAFGVPVEGQVPIGRVLFTPGVSAQSEDFRCAVMEAVATYETFHTDSDPYGTHEMGVIEIDGTTVWFKIDLYDENYEYGTSDPTDLRFTRRVLTLLLPSEY